jgi:hypothetical protein
MPRGRESACAFDSFDGAAQARPVAQRTEDHNREPADYRESSWTLQSKMAKICRSKLARAICFYQKRPRVSRAFSRASRHLKRSRRMCVLPDRCVPLAFCSFRTIDRVRTPNLASMSKITASVRLQGPDLARSEGHDLGRSAEHHEARCGLLRGINFPKQDCRAGISAEVCA